MDAQKLGGRWGTVAASVMRRPGISVAAKAVYAALATYADRIGWIWVKQETIASDLERSRAWVHAAIAELEHHSLLLHDRQYIEGRQRASRYRLLDGLARQAGQPQIRAPGIGAPDHLRPEDSVSEKSDAAVHPADTSHHDDNNNSPSRAREPVEPASDGRTVVRGQVPADWVPTTGDTAWARARHPDLDVLAFTEAFVLSCRAKNYRYADVSAAWRRWLIEPKGQLPLAAPATTKAAAEASKPKDLRHEPVSQQRRASAASTAGLADSNARQAADVLERIMARRAGRSPARPAA
jgi:hypothetical protein